MKRRRHGAAAEGGSSPSERLLFGGPMRYDAGFVRHEEAGVQAGLWAVARQIPGMLRLAWRLARRADRTARAGVVLAEIGRAGAAALSPVVADEPTSALDPAAEVRAFDSLRRLAGQGATVLLITHRLAACAAADLIYVLKDGRLVEQGTHEELMAVGAEDERPAAGGYRAAYLLQAEQYATRLPGPRSAPTSPAAEDEDEGSLR
ncbi:hypothetical protein HUT16_01080 [Kitasatospora sp. NA04385]|uniref:hypothetical protein n=1 Tax=Kitasatospora sp. NA04385 TaxID=2742135 RepID=UPI00158FA1DE|nr:hypothetical protein [Kitasatospora sp. NA04385]QKW17841.1 hypothetical protein HUT16_01080 [Kitasatospora sp. NA04385]